jgi:hypothetical protein
MVRENGWRIFSFRWENISIKWKFVVVVQISAFSWKFVIGKTPIDFSQYIFSVIYGIGNGNVSGRAENKWKIHKSHVYIRIHIKPDPHMLDMGAVMGPIWKRTNMILFFTPLSASFMRKSGLPFRCLLLLLM